MAGTMVSPNDNEKRWRDLEAQQKYLSPNHIRSKPAKDSVITGIISSLDSMEGTRKSHTIFTPASVPERDSSATRPLSPAESYNNAPIVPFSLHNGTRQDSSDDEFEDDIAAPPVISTTRSPSRINRASLQAEEMRASSLQERTNSKKLSSESWVKQPQDSPQPLRKQIRRVSSHDTLRQAQPDKDFQVDQDFIFDSLGSLGVIPQPDRPSKSPKANGKSRLYIGDSVEDMRSINSLESESTRSRRSSAGPSTPIVRKTRQNNPKPSPIEASIPLRTSSLRQSSSPASSKRKTRASSKPKYGGATLQRTISEDTAADSRWSDLGEDDETVKRILELRRKRETRILDKDNTAALAESLRELSPSPPVKTSTPKHPEAIPPKATRILGLDSESGLGNDYNTTFTGNGDERLGQPQGSIGAMRAAANSNSSAHLNQRPTTSKSAVSYDRPLSLEYSYADAVNALQSAEREIQKRNGMTSVAARPTNFHRRTTSQTSNNASPAKTKKARGRWGQDSEIRRRSMDDARDDFGDRRDSIEDAVETYLRSSRLSQKVSHPHTGRIISFSEVGDPNGAAVIVCLGMGLTKYTSCFYDELATTLRLRLITLERPGVGESQALPNNDRSGPLMWPGDVTTVCDHLGITNFSILAHSAGAIYAMATALILPNRIRGSIHLLGPAIPPSQLENASSEDIAASGGLPRSQKFLRALPTPFLKAANSSFMSAASASLKPVKRKSGSSPYRTLNRADSESPNRGAKRPTTAGGRPENARRESLMLMDRVVPDTLEGSGNDDEQRRVDLGLSATATPMDYDLEYAAAALSAAEHSNRAKQSAFNTRLIEKTWERAIKDSNPAFDLLWCLERNRDIGFRYTDVTRRVIITHGALDKRVPVKTIKFITEQINRAALSRQVESRDALPNDPGAIPGCELRVLPDQGHGLMANGTVLGDVLTEIAGYWTAEERGRSMPQVEKT